jgi:hypothetical protein
MTLNGDCAVQQQRDSLKGWQRIGRAAQAGEKSAQALAVELSDLG